MTNKLIFIFILEFLTITVFGQDRNIHICVEGPYWRVRSCYGVPFISEKGSEDFSIFELGFNELYCKNFNKTFSINQLPISEHDFYLLHLNMCDIDSEKCYYTEEYSGDSISQINFYAMVKIPIFIDGKEIQQSDTLLTTALQDKKLKFHKEKRFFRKNRIIVEKERR